MNPGFSGHRHTTDAKRAIGEASRNRFIDGEARRVMSAKCKAAFGTEEARALRRSLRRQEWADPAIRARRVAGNKRYQAEQRLMRGVEVPSWVPEDLRDEFRELAAAQGEEAAASVIRALKACSSQS